MVHIKLTTRRDILTINIYKSKEYKVQNTDYRLKTDTYTLHTHTRTHLNKGIFNPRSALCCDKTDQYRNVHTINMTPHRTFSLHI